MGALTGPRVWTDAGSGRSPEPASDSLRETDQPRRFVAVTIRVGINGFGRIGRNFWRAANAGATDDQQSRGLEIVAANDLGDIKTMAHLLKYDTLLGTLKEDVSVDGDVIRVGDKQIGRHHV